MKFMFLVFIILSAGGCKNKGTRTPENGSDTIQQPLEKKAEKTPSTSRIVFPLALGDHFDKYSLAGGKSPYEVLARQAIEKLYGLNTQKVELIGAKSKDSILDVSQGKIGFSKKGSKTPIIATCGAGPCVIVAGYERKNSVGFLAHLDQTFKESDFETINKKLETLIGERDRVTVDIFITGGVQAERFNSTIKMVEDWRKTIPYKYRIVFEEYQTEKQFLDFWEGKNNGSERSSMALDIRDGSIYRYYTPSPDRHSSGLPKKLEIIE